MASLLSNLLAELFSRSIRVQERTSKYRSAAKVGPYSDMALAAKLEHLKIQSHANFNSNLSKSIVGDMTALYKRYIPPKPNANEPSVTSVNTASHVAADATKTNPETKRKRERTQDEINDRKAKKLKKKGIEAVNTVIPKAISKSADIVKQRVEVEDGDQELSANKRLPQKKRHRLEKEARRARKEAEKNGLNGQEVLDHPEGSLSPRHETPSGVAAISSNGSARRASVDSNLLGLEPSEQTSKKKKARTKEKDGESYDGTKAHNTAGQEGIPDADGEPNDAEIPSEAQSLEEQPRPKKRRHKLEAVIEESSPGIQNVEDEHHLRKHTSVLGKFQKSSKRMTQNQPNEASEATEKTVAQPTVQHLELPPAERTPTPEIDSEDATLPLWLAKPTFVTTDKKTSFKGLGIASETAERLARLGFTEALPVQQALVPLLMPPGLSGATFPPGTEDVLPDVAVSAPTGSGKTLAYLLPMIEALKRRSQPGRLSALIVVPTRELVLQVAAVAESLVKGSSIKVGMTTGTSKFKDEQDKIIKRSARYDPASYKYLVGLAESQIYPPDEESEEFQAHGDAMDEEDVKRQQWIQDTLHGVVGHVPTYNFAVDILVATPGRLLEHLNSTVGFNLVHLQWLIVDEADKLLDNQYEGFLETLHTELTRARSEEEQDSREKYLRSQGLWEAHRERQLRKAVLSATMTRDISKLTSLKLQRPKMIVVRGAERNDDVEAQIGATEEQDSVRISADGFELPRNLVEYCVPVGDGSEKPLVAVELLKSKIMGESSGDAGNAGKDIEDLAVAKRGDDESNSDSDSDSDSDSSSDDSSNLSSDDSDSFSSASDADEDSQSEDDDLQEDHPPSSSIPPPRKILSASTTSSSRAPTILVFTSNNESANRLAHLLRGIKPEWNSRITTLVKTKPGKARIRSKLNEPAIVISTDRAARGLDSFSDRLITHVIQYDVPRSVTSYVHRVGRTARAGRDGDAWTLYTHAEARWFVNEITKAKNVIRRAPVERVKLFMADENVRRKYEDVLASMKDEVFGGAS